MAQKLLTEIKVESTDISSDIITYKVEETWGDFIEKAEIVLSRNVYNTLSTITEGDSVTIKRGFTTATDEFIFEGMVTKITRESGKVILDCRDLLYEAVKANIIASYDINIDPAAGVLSEIFIDIVNNYTSLTADNTSVTSSGTFTTIDKLIFKNDDVYDALNKIADLLDWYIRYDPVTSKVQFHPKGTTVYGTTLKVGAASGNNILNVPKWKFDSNKMINKVTIHGASQIDNRIEQFNGTGAQTVFTLATTPEDTTVYVGGTLKTRGISGASTSYDYTVDEDEKTVTFEVAPPVGTNNVEINYGTNIPVPVTASDTTSIATYGGPHKTPNETAFFEKDIKTVDDAEKRARGIITKYGTPFISSELRIKDAIDIKSGYIVDVEDNINDQTRSLFVSKVTMEYPYNGDIVQVGDEAIRLEDWGVDADKKIRDLQVESSKNQDILVQVEDLGVPITFRRKSLKIEKRDVNGSGIFGSPSHGILGTSVFGLTAGSWSTLYEEDYTT